MFSTSDSLIQAQMQADAQKTAAQRWQIMSETSLTIRELNNQTFIDRMQSSGRHNSAVTNYIRF